MNVYVKGGTNAGRKQPLKPKPGPWYCACIELRPGYLVRCPDCGADRPNR